MIALIVIASVLGLLALVLFFGSVIVVPQNNVAVVIRFGKYQGLRQAGLSLKAPLIDGLRRITLQNISSELQFQAITIDQAAVTFKALIIYSVKDATEENLKKVSFLFYNQESFLIALNKTIEGLARTLIAGKKQQEVLGLRQEIVDYIQEHIKEQMDKWGWALHDIQINDIAFAQSVMESMQKVVASKNLLSAAENEGNAKKITLTLEAEARGAAVVIEAKSQKEAEVLRGQGVAGFRAEIAKGLKSSVDEVGGHTEQVNNAEAIQLIAYSMWMDTLKTIVEKNQGNFLNFDGSPEGMRKFFEATVIKSNGKTLSQN